MCRHALIDAGSSRCPLSVSANSDAAKVDGKPWKCSVGPVDAQGVCFVSGDQLQSLELAPEVEQELLAKVSTQIPIAWVTR